MSQSPINRPHRKRFTNNPSENVGPWDKIRAAGQVLDKDYRPITLIRRIDGKITREQFRTSSACRDLI